MHAVAFDAPDVVEQMRGVRTHGVDRVADVTLRLFGSDDCPSASKQQAAADLTAAAADGALAIPIADPRPLEEIAAAHDRVDSGGRRRVPLVIPYRASTSNLSP